MNLRLESAAGYQSGGFEIGSANGKHKAQSAQSGTTSAPEKAIDSRPVQETTRVAAISENKATDYPRLVGPEAPSSLLFEASLAISAKKRTGGESNGAHIDFPRMINRRWVPSPSQLQMLEELK